MNQRLHSSRNAIATYFSVIAAFVLQVTLLNAQPFVNWETPPDHPVDLSPDGTILAVCNLPDNRVEFFDMSLGVPISLGHVAVGLDPVTVRFRTNGEAWVVNHISDTVSIVDVATRRVTATIDTLDEPHDVVFVAGSPQKAFVSMGEANSVRVYDASTRAVLSTVAIDAENPKSLAVSPDGTKVYVAIFESGNGSTVLGGGFDTGGGTLAFPPNVVNDAAGPYGGVNPPPNVGGVGGTFSPAKSGANGTAPAVALIVKKDAGGLWKDDNNQNWTNLVSGASSGLSGRPGGWDLPDRDVAIINTTTYDVTYATRLMNMCMAVSVNPATGNVYVIGTDGINEVRFEPNVNGKFVRVKLGVVNPTGTTTVGNLDLNAHLNYLASNIAPSEREKSIGDPRGIVWNAAGTRGYITGMGSNNLIVIDATGQRVLGTDTTPVNILNGPTGITLDEARNQLYVLNRFDGTVSVLNATTLAERARVSFFDPTPAAIRTGRPHFYDTHKSSGLGQAACASCHVDGKMDRLAWDLGDPSGALDSTAGSNNGNNILGTLDANFHPMKGPMTTQTFQDIIGKEPHHWRGDRDGLEDFNPAFVGLQGADFSLTTSPSGGEMQEFENFVATIFFPPNPFRNFDNTLPTNFNLAGHYSDGRFAGSGGLAAGAQLPNGNAQTGRDIYRLGAGGTPLDAQALDCVSCHTLPTGAGPNRRIQISGISATFPEVALGPNGQKHLIMVAVDGSTQDAIKIPQTRNLYKKVGFEMTPGHTQNRAGFGFTHDGSVDSIARFVSEPIFNVRHDQDVANLVAFMLAFSGSDLPLGTTSTSNVLSTLEPLGELSNDSHAATGKQLTITTTGANATLTSMIAQANKVGPNPRGLDLVARGRDGNGVMRGWHFNNTTNPNFISDRDSDAGISEATLRALASAGNPLTFTLVPRGSGRRIGTDRDGDNFGDRSEIEACSNPDDATITPASNKPEIATTPAMPGGSLNFGSRDIAAGATASQPATISNTGLASLQFTGAKIVVTGPNASDFGFASVPSTAAIAASSARNVDVVFDPTGVGAKSAFLSIITNDCDEGVLHIALSGIGTDSVTPTPTPTPSDDAVITGSNLPAQIPASNGVPTRITVVNTGVTTWDAAGGYALSVVNDSCDLIALTQIELAPEIVVAPGGTHVFEALLTVPGTLGPCTLEFRMIQDGGVGLFGSPLSLNPTIVSPFNDADFVNAFIPATIPPNQGRYIGIRMKNTGNTVWYEGSGHALEVLGGACLIPAETQLLIQPGDAVMPNQSYDFTAFVTTPASLGACGIEYRMIETLVGSFGDTANAQTLVAEPPNSTSDWSEYE